MQQMQSTEVQSQRVGIIGTIKLAERLAQPLPTSSSQPGPHGGVPSADKYDTCYRLHIAFCHVTQASCPPEASLPSQNLSLSATSCLVFLCVYSKTVPLATNFSAAHAIAKQQEVFQQCQAS